MNREQLSEKIKSAQEELKTAGVIHRRDLIKHIRRMQKDIRDYDRYHRG